MDDDALLDLATRMAWAAADIIVGVRARGFETRQKADRSPVTEADQAAETLIALGLRAETPGIPVVAEEEVEAGYEPPPADQYWLVDPLDGTREFAAGRNSFTVNIGLVRHGRPVLGAVAVPAFAEMFTGIVGVGAWKQDRAGRRPIRARERPAIGADVLASRHYANDRALAAFLETETVASVAHMGSAIKICRIAEGLADLYPRLGRTMEWDTAGPEAVLLGAGGRLSQMDGTALVYGKPHWANPPFLCRGA